MMQGTSSEKLTGKLNLHADVVLKTSSKGADLLTYAQHRSQQTFSYGIHAAQLMTTLTSVTNSVGWEMPEVRGTMKAG